MYKKTREFYEKCNWEYRVLRRVWMGVNTVKTIAHSLKEDPQVVRIVLDDLVNQGVLSKLDNRKVVRYISEDWQDKHNILSDAQVREKIVNAINKGYQTLGRISHYIYCDQYVVRRNIGHMVAEGKLREWTGIRGHMKYTCVPCPRRR